MFAKLKKWCNTPVKIETNIFTLVLLGLVLSVSFYASL